LVPLASRSDDRVDGERELVVLGEAVEEVLGAVVVADLGADLEVAADLVAGKRSDRQADRSLVEALA
jgi:hypothetical protein